MTDFTGEDMEGGEDLVSHVDFAPAPWDEVKDIVSAWIEDEAADDPSKYPGPGIVQFSLEIEPVNPLAWLRAHGGPDRIYWRSRNQAHETAGLGAADTVSGSEPSDVERVLDYVNRQLSHSFHGPRYYGGLRFDLDPVSEGAWESFGAARFVLPRFEVTARDGGCEFSCNIVRDLEEEWEQTLANALRDVERLRDDLETTAGDPAPALLERRDRPDHEAWLAAVGEVLKARDRGELSKAVLARESTFRFDGTPDPLALLERLQSKTQDSYHFLFETGAGSFFGASPERLYRRVNSYIKSEALAGTRPRGADEQEDVRLGRELMASEKEIREHGYVADALREGFNRLCRHVDDSEALSLVRLDRCQHIGWSIQGLLREDATDGAILEALHPTPAVAGTPTDKALTRIRELEPFDRGWYAGPFGWIGYDAAEFAVAIRSGLQQGETVSLYSGAGIVPGSEPEAEWAEIENKMSTFAGCLG
ncbi:MAG: isochorismate synthase MenF [Candidatus Hydrogenedentota bacterium]